METSIGNIPRHVAIIMDGNGRWAEEHGKERIFGHMNGVESVRNAVRASVRNGVRYLTLYAFSTENWGRPVQEVEALMELLCKSIVNEGRELCEQGVRVEILGDRSRMSEKVQEHLSLIERETSAGDRLTLILALNYSSRWEITRMAQRIAREAAEGKIAPEEIDQQTVAGHMATAAWPDPDLLIRTSGERRLSNFLLWQLAYTELYFTDIYWPDFTEAEFDKAIRSYQSRERRYGLTTKQRREK
ncbi:isoprenyl transferase [Gallalistipes aquisgranensis]|uniref:isoprenyl transferase n=1 Tax=Gallalistipes aquisgranensis TaxID=2779358 RepID=UPI001CF7EDCD|nr:isoprenyl transferase [Gallalistipes aquisgranensis]MBE5033352.1 isoprenyl transferase [Gallalistipes aquisgranensis]